MFRIALICLLSLPLFAQKPSIAAVTNAATLAPMTGPGHAVAPGSIGTIFGQNLASGTAPAQGYPLPVLLAGTSVTVDGVSAPLFYVSPTQINFQVPYATIPLTSAMTGEPPLAYGHAAVVVSTAEGASDSFTADTLPSSPGLFTMDESGCGQGVIFNVNPDGSLALNSPSNSAPPVSFVAIYLTGLGFVSNPPPDGSPALANPLSSQSYGGCANFGGEMCYGSNFLGRAPDLVGVDQLNDVTLPDVQQGCAVPLTYAGSQPVLISIHSGGGQCVDPPIGSEGEITLTKSVVLNNDTIPESDTLTASFAASPGRRVRSPVPSGGFYPQHPSCAIPGYSTLNAGPMTVTGPGNLSATVNPTTSGGKVSYQGSLPAGAVQPGVFQLSSEGGPDIGAFRATVNVGAPIQITSQFPPGQLQENGEGGVTAMWTGGQAGETVTLTVREHMFLSDYVIVGQAPATAGILALKGLQAPTDPSAPPTAPYFSQLLLASSDVEVDVEVGPDPAQPQIVPAPGLTLGAMVNWKYQYRFIGLTF